MQPGQPTKPRSIEQDQILLDAIVDIGLAFAQDLRPPPHDPRYTPVQARALIESLHEVARIVRRTVLLKHSLPRIAARPPAADRVPTTRDPAPTAAPAAAKAQSTDAEPRMRLDEIDSLRSDFAEIRSVEPRPPAPSRAPLPPDPALARDLARIAPRPRAPDHLGPDLRTPDLRGPAFHLPERTLVPAGADHPPRPPNPD